MNLLFERLRELLPDLEAGPEEVASRLTLAGVAVERVIPDGETSRLELDLTSNRPDLLSYAGVAREVGALFRTRTVLPRVELREEAQPARDAARVAIEDARLCPRYSARVVRGVRVAPSAEPVRRLLQASGIRSINNVVDATNLVLLELGHPTHAFDLARLEESRIVVRRARLKESLTTLDGVVRALDPDDQVIADATRPVALAGIMGGADSEIAAGTRDVLVESAFFDPQTVRRSARRHGLRTEASIRFERRADPEATVRAADRAAALIVEMAGGSVLQGVIDEYPVRVRHVHARLRLARLEALLGMQVRASEVLRVLEALGFKAMPIEAGAVDVEIPTFRGDVEREVDLVEEVGRIVGYDSCPSRLPPSPRPPAGRTRAQERERVLRETLAGAGFSEAITLSMVDPEREEAWLGAGRPLVRIANPLTERLSALRGSIVSGLLEVVGHNLRHGAEAVQVFEVATTFAPDPAGGLPIERRRLGLAAAGTVRTRGGDRFRPLDAWDVQGALELAARALRLPPGTWASEAGLLEDAATLDRHGIAKSARVAYAEIDLQDALESDAGTLRYRPFARFPAVTRDVSVFLAAGGSDLPYAEVERAIRAAAPPGTLESVTFVDHYQGSGRTSLTLRLTYRHPERTLAAEEVDGAHAHVRAALRSDPRLELRES